ncbi:MAG: hypothetical protein ACYSUD_16245 [Planctomycetota bacterium]|jgi:hypothetical protein
MDTIKKYGMIVSYRCLLAFFLVLALLLVLLIQSQESYAETKKVAGTCKAVNRIASSEVPYTEGAGAVLQISQLILNSDDTNFNNVKQLVIAILKKVDPLKVSSPKDRVYSGYIINTYPNGDQTWSLYEGVWSPLPEGGSAWTWERNSYSIEGTGKYEGVESSSISKGKMKGQEMESCEWELEYEIKK